MPLTQVQGQMLNGSNNTTTTIQSNGTTAITIDSSQNVGIGTSSPASSAGYTALTLNNATNSGYVVLQTNGVTTSDWYVSGGTVATLRGVAVPISISSTGANYIALSTNSSERMRITSGGDLLVGTTSALSNPAKVQISGGSGSTITSETTGTGATDHVNFRNGNGKVGTITTNGSATSYNTSSDYRLKENIAPMTGALVKVAQLKPVTYNWKADGSDGQGFIAHELQAVVPDAVTGEKDAVDENGNPRYQGVDTSFLVATLTAAIQELKAELDATKAEVAELKAKGQ